VIKNLKGKMRCIQCYFKLLCILPAQMLTCIMRKNIELHNYYIELKLCARRLNPLGKILLNPLNYSWWTTSPQNYKNGYSTPKFFKTSQITPQVVLLLWHGFIFYLFIFGKSLKIIVIIENHKMENHTLLVSTWVDLHNKHTV